MSTVCVSYLTERRHRAKYRGTATTKSPEAVSTCRIRSPRFMSAHSKSRILLTKQQIYRRAREKILLSMLVRIIVENIICLNMLIKPVGQTMQYEADLIDVDCNSSRTL